MAQPDNVIRPDQFTQDYEDDLPEDFEVIGVVPPQRPSGDPMEAVVRGAGAVVNTVYDNRILIRNTAYVLIGTYLAVKGPPILAKSFADTMHYLREGWYGRGDYGNSNSNRKKED